MTYVIISQTEFSFQLFNFDEMAKKIHFIFRCYVKFFPNNLLTNCIYFYTQLTFPSVSSFIIHSLFSPLFFIVVYFVFQFSGLLHHDMELFFLKIWRFKWSFFDNGL